MLAILSFWLDGQHIDNFAIKIWNFEMKLMVLFFYLLFILPLFFTTMIYLLLILFGITFKMITSYGFCVACDILNFAENAFSSMMMVDFCRIIISFCIRQAYRKYNIVYIRMLTPHSYGLFRIWIPKWTG
ncbi:hypothetical protein WA158_003853 [Blastocystis sp. Blastoise]